MPDSPQATASRISRIDSGTASPNSAVTANSSATVRLTSSSRSSLQNSRSGWLEQTQSRASPTAVGAGARPGTTIAIAVRTPITGPNISQDRPFGPKSDLLGPVWPAGALLNAALLGRDAVASSTHGSVAASPHHALPPADGSARVRR